MYKGLKVCAVIAAAGKSRRMGGGINKQLIMIKDMPVLAHTLKAFDSADIIDGIILVAGQDDGEDCRENVIKKYGIDKIKAIVQGGDERQQSVKSGLDAALGVCDIVVVHDGARPFVTKDIIYKSVEEAYEFGAAVCAVPVKDTIKVSRDGEFISNSIDRNTLYAVQTPQTFRFDLLYKAHNKAAEDSFLGTDDTVLVERIGIRVKIFEGSYENIKITTPEDIYIAESILEQRAKRDTYHTEGGII